MRSASPSSAHPRRQDLVSKLLQTNPQQRYTANQCLRHPWILGHVKEGLLPQANVELLKSFNNKCALHLPGVRARSPPDSRAPLPALRRRKNSVAGSPLVGSYSMFGSLSSPFDGAVHGPGKHARLGRSVPHTECGSVAEEGPVEQTTIRVPVEVGVSALGASHAAHDAAVPLPAGHPSGGIAVVPKSGPSIPVPVPGSGPQGRQADLATSPPLGMLSASPNPGGAFMMEI